MHMMHRFGTSRRRIGSSLSQFGTFSVHNDNEDEFGQLVATTRRQVTSEVLLSDACAVAAAVAGAVGAAKEQARRPPRRRRRSELQRQRVDFDLAVAASSTLHDQQQQG